MNDMDAFKELVKKSPDVELMNIDQLHGSVFWSGAALKWSKTQIDIAKEIGGMSAQIDAWAAEGNAAAELNFTARAKRGELAKQTEAAKPKPQPGIQDPKTGRMVGGGAAPSGELPKWKRLGYKSEQAMKDDELLHSHPDVVEKVKKQAKAAGDFPSVTAVKNERRAQRAEAAAKRAKERAAEIIEKDKAKLVKNVPHGVSEYFTALKEFRDKLMLTVEGAKREQWFAPESINIVVGKHNEIRELLAELETNI